jgi:hypothetical protein
MWGALSDERTRFLWISATGSRQRSQSWVRVSWDSWPYATVSDSRLPEPGEPGHRIYIPQELGGPIITPGTGFPFRRLLRFSELVNLIVFKTTPQCGRHRKYRSSTSIVARVRFCRNVFTEPLLRNRLQNSVGLLLRACMLRSLPSNGRCLQRHRLVTGLYATILLLLHPLERKPPFKEYPCRQELATKSLLQTFWQVSSRMYHLSTANKKIFPFGGLRTIHHIQFHWLAPYDIF